MSVLLLATYLPLNRKPPCLDRQKKKKSNTEKKYHTPETPSKYPKQRRHKTQHTATTLTGLWAVPRGDLTTANPPVQDKTRDSPHSAGMEEKPQPKENGGLAYHDEQPGAIESPADSKSAIENPGESQTRWRCGGIPVRSQPRLLGTASAHGCRVTPKGMRSPCCSRKPGAVTKTPSDTDLLKGNQILRGIRDMMAPRHKCPRYDFGAQRSVD